MRIDYDRSVERGRDKRPFSLREREIRGEERHRKSQKVRGNSFIYPTMI